MDKSGLLLRIGRLAVFLVLLLCWTWGMAAIYYMGPGDVTKNIIITVLYAALLPFIFWLTRSFRGGLFCSFILFALLLFWWQSLTPSGDKDWAPDVTRVSHGEIQGDRLIMYNVRNFRYTDEDNFTTRWETREYDLEKLQNLDIFLSYWASDHITHTIMSWDFGEDNHLAISIETRKDKSQSYSAVQGFFKQFELIYIAADERDVIRLRTNYLKERVYYYRLNVSKEASRAFLENYLEEMERLSHVPEFYNALTRNCTTTIHLHSRAVGRQETTAFDWRLILNGHVDELLYDRSVISRDMAFDVLRKASRIDLYMQKYGVEGFSRKLREKWRLTAPVKS